MRKIFLLILLFIPLWVYSQYSGEKSKVENAVEEGRYEDAIVILEKSVSSPENGGYKPADRALMLASAYCSIGNMKMCRQTLVSAFPSPPTNIDVVDDYAEIAYIDDEKYDQYHAFADRMTGAYPEMKANLLRLKGKGYLHQSDFANADSLLQEALDMDSTNVQIRRDAALSAISHGYSLAREAYGEFRDNIPAELKQRIIDYLLRGTKALTEVFPYLEGNISDEYGKKFGYYYAINESCSVLHELGFDIKNEQWLIDFVDSLIEE